MSYLMRYKLYFYFIILRVWKIKTQMFVAPEFPVALYPDAVPVDAAGVLSYCHDEHNMWNSKIHYVIQNSGLWLELIKRGHMGSFRRC